MDIETLDVDGIKFISCVFLSFGDYDGSTDVQLYAAELAEWEAY